MATHVTRIERPVTTDYRGHTVCKCGPWTQGPYLLEALKLLEGFDLESMGFQSPETIHVIVESMKLALADRDVYYGDPLFVDVPIEKLLSQKYADVRRSLIDFEQASKVQRPGDPEGMKPMRDTTRAGFGLGGPNTDTSTCLVVDRWGSVVAATPSGWGGALAGETGVWLGSRLISFNTCQGHPNCIAPGKRPRITLTPTIVLKDAKPILAVSVAGGDTQDQATLQMVTNFIDFGLSVDDLVSTPRYATEHYVGSFGQLAPRLGELTIDTSFGKQCLRQLAEWGHTLNCSGNDNVPQQRTALVIDDEAGTLHAAGDPQANPPRTAAAF
jgi:gamma-glutamyltranspeptidase/glutathione hydrolase